MRGYQKFRAQYFAQSLSSTRFKTLVQQGQKPKIMVISCSDSRVEPSIMFNCAPGELFVVRNVANLVPPCEPNPRHHSTSAALEFAVNHLLVKHIIVLGHSQCGGIKALLETPDFSSAEKTNKIFIFNWMQIAKEAKNKVLVEHNGTSSEEQGHYCEEEALRISLKNLRTFPWIEDKIVNGQLFLHAWRFDFATGNIRSLSPTSNRFEDISGEELD